MAKWSLSLFLVITSICSSCRSEKQTKGATLDNTAIDNVQGDSLRLDSIQVVRNIIRLRDSLTVRYDSFRLNTLNTTIAEIAKYNRVDHAHVEGIGTSNQWIRFGLLKRLASDSALVTLTDHKNTTVRSYAFQALAERHSDKTFSILVNHLQDTARVTSASDWFVFIEPVADYLISVARLEPAQRAIVDSLVLFDKTVNLGYRSLLLADLKPKATYYERVKELVQKQRNASALVALARFHNQSDKELIASFFKDVNTQTDALRAMNEFADPYFYLYLRNFFEQEWKEGYYTYPTWGICYQALAQYPNAETMELFKRTTLIKNKSDYESLCKYLLIAIRKHPHPLYQPLEKKIKLSKKQMQAVNEYLANDYRY